MPAARHQADDFALRLHEYGRFTGMGLAVHAVRDAFFLQHGGVGCKQKGANQIMPHDLSHPALHRMGYTEMDERSLILGSAARIGPYVRSWHQKRALGYMVVTSVSFLEMTGEDFAGAVRAAAATVPFPVDFIRSRGFDGDLYQGWGEVVGRILRRIPFGARRPEEGTVSVAGFVFDRYEADVAADLEQMRRLLGALGLRTGPFLLGGSPFAELLAAADSGRIVCLPYARAIPAADLEGIGRPRIPTGLPVGFSGTSRWLRDVAAGCALRGEVVEGVVHRAMARLEPGLQNIRRRLRAEGLCAAIFAETPLAAALAAWAEEIGVRPILVGLRDDSLGGAPAFRREVERLEARLPGDMALLANPPLEKVQLEVQRLIREGRLRVLLGSAHEVSAVGRAPGVAVLEVGFPRTSFHPREASPTYGYTGAQNLCRRVLDQLDRG